MYLLFDFIIFFFQAEDGIRDAQESRGLGDVYKRQIIHTTSTNNPIPIKNPAMIPEFCNAREKYQLLCLAHAIAGSCLALGLRYAGSGNLEARDLILEELSGFSKGFVGRSRIKLREGVSAIEDCVSSLSLIHI
eukprot:TRINITY_DN49624_c0_g1_i1.p1 TRINITY_DN49624_c0_g1~~TRINITY_DN49624_c0_g1_i1.p1  ORF type:complete len:134 (+),score=30.20 TRINITY_DN49624_c0_g1_i1:107-508(+)